MFLQGLYQSIVRQAGRGQMPGLVGAGLGLPILGVVVLVPFFRSQADPSVSLPPVPTQSPSPISTPFLGEFSSLRYASSPEPLTIPTTPTSTPTSTPTPATISPKIPTQPATSALTTTAIKQPTALQPVPPSQGQSPEVRVAVVRNQTQVTVGVSANVTITDDHGQAWGVLSANQGVTLRPESGGLVGWSRPLPPSIWLNPDSQGLVYVNGHWYRGKMRLIMVNNEITAINQLDLEQYLVAVVGAEVYPSWPMHTLKAQAIAARSYALAQMFRPASRYFDLGNTERWQVYRGIKDEWSTTQAAVQSTRGIVLTHSGRVMVSMYAATDDIVRDVFGGRGMSQTGAYELGKQGYSYLQILGNYYPGASLSQIQ